MPDHRTIQQKFEDFHHGNPKVYDELVRMARVLQARGHARVGIELLFAQIRWMSLMSTSGDDDGFRLNNSFTSRYARLILAEHPEFDALFEIRTLRAA
jgi:hypothetical protein